MIKRSSYYLTACFLFSNIFLAIPYSALAKEATANIDVTATVCEACTIVAAPLAFGNYLQSNLKDAETTLNVTCTNHTDYNVKLDKGKTPDGTVRRMKGVKNELLHYHLFSDNGRTTPWPDGGINGKGAGVAQTIKVFGRIPAGEIAGEDNYKDAVTVTLTF